MLPQILNMANLETGVVECGNDPADLMELTIREYITFDKAPATDDPALPCFGPAYGVVDDSATRRQEVGHLREVLLQSCQTDMFEHSYGADRIERTVAYVAVVLQPDLNLSRNPVLSHALGCEICLILRDRHSNSRYIMLFHSVEHHASPPASNVQKPHTWLEAQFRADQFMLVLLRLFKRICG